MTRTTKTFLSFAFIGLSLAALTAQPNVHLEGWGFTIATMDNEVTAFSNRDYVFRNVPEQIRGWEYSRLNGGENLAEFTATPDQSGYLYVVTAASLPGTDMSGWEEIATDGFYYTDGAGTSLQLFRKSVGVGETVPVPQGNWTGGMLVAPVITGVAGEPQRDDSTVPGTVVAHSPQTSGIYIGSPGLVALDNGVYVAKYDAFGPGSTERDTAVTYFLRSEDAGETWEEIHAIDGLFWASLFLHNGSLYALGTDRLYGNTVIYRSDDGGLNWTSPTNADNGLLYSGPYHTAPMPVVIHNGRIWRAMETAEPGFPWPQLFGAFMMSAPVDADLLRSDSWVRSNVLHRDGSWLNGEFNGWLEGNAVVDRDGGVVNILRVDRFAGGTAAIIEVSEDGTTATFDPANGFISFPGGAKKFTIRYDPVSDLYWTLSNYVPPVHAGRNAGATRNTLALASSSDLREWEVRSIVIYHPEVSTHGYQYVDWLFEGEDIIALSRTANDDGLGGAASYHDANYLTFHRIIGFRDLTMADSVVDPADLGISYERPTELTGHWKLDETNPDSLVVVNSAPSAAISGERTASVQIDQPGLAGRAYRFAGGERVDTRSPDWVPATGDFSVFAWVATDSFHSTQGHVLSNNTTPLHLGRSNLAVMDGSAMYFLGGDNNLLLTGETGITDGEWHHIGVTREGDTVTLWVNGLAEATGTASTAVRQENSWAIGATPAGAFPFNGLIDDVGIWRGSVLTPDEISVIGGLGRIGFPLSSETEIEQILSLFGAGTGSVRTGDWIWSPTTDFGTPSDGSGLALGKHYRAVDGDVYVILDGEAATWSGVVAEKIEPWTYLRWLETHFEADELENTELTGTTATPAGDGVPNLLKYAFGGLAPKEPAPMKEMVDLDRSEAGLAIHYSRLKDANDLFYTVEVSTDLQVWNNGPDVSEVIGVEDHGDWERVTVRAKLTLESPSSGFMRVRVDLLDQ